MTRAGLGGAGGTVYAKVDHSRSLFTGLLSPGSANNNRASACFSGPLVETGETEEENCVTSLLVGSQSPAEYVIYSPDTPGDRVLLGASVRESKV